MIDTYNNVFGTSFGYAEVLYFIFVIVCSIWATIQLRKYQNKAFKKYFKDKSITNVEMLYDWFTVNSRVALNIYTGYTDNVKHVKAIYLISEENMYDLEYLANIKGMRYVSSTANLVKATKDINIVKSLFYLVDYSGVSYVILTASNFNLLRKDKDEETFEIKYIVESIYVVENNKLSKIKQVDVCNLLIANKNIHSMNYDDYKDVVISNLRMEEKANINTNSKVLHGNCMYFSITNMDNINDFKVYDFKINIHSENHFTPEEVLAPGDE